MQNIYTSKKLVCEKKASDKRAKSLREKKTTIVVCENIWEKINMHLKKSDSAAS